MLPVLFEVPLPAWRMPLGEHVVQPFDVSAFGLLLALGLSCGVLSMLAFGARLGWSRRSGVTTLAGMGLAALLAGRIGYVAVSSEPSSSLSSFIAIGQGGLSAYGALLGAALYVGSRARGGELWRDLDLLAIGVATTLLFGKLGCYLHGCDFGRPLGADAPLWLKKLGTFPRWTEHSLGAGSPAWWQQVAEGELSPTAALSLSVHPVQLYEAALATLLLLLVAKVLARRLAAGTGFLVFVWGYGVLRALLELLRGDLDRGLMGPELGAQPVAALTLLLLGVASAFGPLAWWLDGKGRGAKLLGAKLQRRAAEVVVVLLPVLGTLLFHREGRVTVSVSLVLAVTSVLGAAGLGHPGRHRASAS